MNPLLLLCLVAGAMLHIPVLKADFYRDLKLYAKGLLEVRVRH